MPSDDFIMSQIVGQISYDYQSIPSQFLAEMARLWSSETNFMKIYWSWTTLERILRLLVKGNGQEIEEFH